MFIDNTVIYLNDAQQRNFQRWDILGNYVWPNYYIGNSYVEEVQFFKTWISARLSWMDLNMPGNCIQLPLSVDNNTNLTKGKLLKIVDVLGREIIPKPNTTLFYIYDDSRVQKRIIIE
jgi:hypothetical protein